VTVTAGAAYLATSAPDFLDNPLELNSPPSIDCKISVAFSGSYNPGLPNGGNQFWYDGALAYGVGFTVFGEVNDNERIGPMGSNQADPSGGGWTIEQWGSAYIVVNGKVDLPGGRATADLNPKVNYEINGNRFRWWDHPGLSTEHKDPHTNPPGLKSYLGDFRFAAKVLNGNKQCEVKFRVLITFNNGNWSYRWGQLR
jgi:hypothetical protein